MASSSGFGSTPGDMRAVHTRFRCGSGCHCLNRPPRVTRRIILQKARRQPVLAHLGLRLHVSRRFQGLFHSPRRGAFHRSLTVLCAIGRCVYVALGSGLPSFTPDCSCRATPSTPWPGSPSLRGYALWAAFQAFRSQAPPVRAAAVAEANPPVSLPAAHRGLGSPGSLATTTGILSLPRGT